MNTNSRNVTAAQALRLRHYQGQRLAAADLQDEYDNQTWLRDLHIVGLHNTWGIALGFEVNLVNRGILVAPGFAYDCFGREIILSQARRIAFPTDLPNAPDGYHLVMSYNIDLGRRQAALDDPLCRPQGDHPDFAWKRPDQTRLGQDVPLLRVVLLDGKPTIDLDIRRYTQSLARPHVGNGVTPPTQIWQAWGFRELVFLQTTIDTSAAGFVGRPFYIATLAFDVALVTAARNQSAKNSSVGSAGADPARDIVPYVFAGIALPSVALDGSAPPQPTPDAIALPQPPSASGFTFRITLDPTQEQGEKAFGRTLASAADDRRRQLSFPYMRVTWLGVEPGSSCSGMVNR